MMKRKLGFLLAVLLLLSFTGCGNSISNAKAQELHYEDQTFYICSAGEDSLLRAHRILVPLSKCLAGEEITCLEMDDQGDYFPAEGRTNTILCRYAPVETDNVYVIVRKGVYSVAILHDAEGYHGPFE